MRSPRRSGEGSASAPLPRERAQPRNLLEIFERSAMRLGERTAVRFKREGAWQALSWKELARRARDLADGLAALGVTRGERIAILAETAVEWIVADLGIMGASAITVPIYQSNPTHECQYVLDYSRVSWVFVGSEEQAAKIREVQTPLSELKGIIRFTGSSRGPGERTLAEVEAAGVSWRQAHPHAHRERLAAMRPDDAACHIYTSGTTGNPKAVVLTHGNWIYEAGAIGQINLISENDRILMFLPMAHSFAKAIEAVWLIVGAELAFVESVDKIVDNAAEVRPTVMPAVPRIFEKAYSAVLAKGLALPGVQGKLFQAALRGFEDWAAGQLVGQKRSSFSFRLGQWLVFPKLSKTLAERFGGRTRVFVSGSAPLTPKIAWFFHLLGFTILEGWGLTESSAGTCLGRLDWNRLGTVGPPLPGTEIRIAEDGEVLVKGGGVMKEYYRNPAATAEVLQDGWLLTGDVGELTADGCLRITDRKKDIIITAGGKNVAPQNLENELKADPLFSHVMVHGDQRKYLSALITLNEQNLRKWAAENQLLLDGDFANHPRVRARVQQTIEALNAKQASYATIKRFAILPKDLTQQAGEITPTLKVRRRFVSQKYQDILDALYEGDP